eukprot:TRINITY_DN2262_c0_g1_i1.p1 TRINITY_DN2262_c0_g1~~TRINITY_DN2262_c0_g1_i1.p1  ORF type:complete len:301 (+),score=33.82 TRINITY_DN2262_c0_g1_i1:57-959(+)
MLGRKLQQLTYIKGLSWIQKGVFIETLPWTTCSQCQQCAAINSNSFNKHSNIPQNSSPLYNIQQQIRRYSEQKVEIAAPEGLGQGEGLSDEELMDLVARGRMSKKLLSKELQDRLVKDRILGPDIYEIPSIPLLFSVVCMIPFYAFCPPLVHAFMPVEYLGLGIEEMDIIARLQVAFSSSMVAFFGAVHWGFAMMEFRKLDQHNSSNGMERYLIGVFPIIASFPCSVVMSPALGSFLNSLFLLVTYVNDRSMYSKDCLPTWYMRIRGPFTAAAVLALLISSVGAFIVAIQDEEFAKKYHL